MQVISSDFLDELERNPHSRLELWELFTSEETDFSPAKAVLRLATAKFTWRGLEYERRVLSRGDIRRYLDKQKNTVTLSLANVDLRLTELVNVYPIEGMWAQCRVISQRFTNESLILFGGRCAKPDELDGVQCRITVEQDFGGDEVQIPRRKQSLTCPLVTDFKGEACRGGAALSTKSTQYQQATTCDGTQRTCVGFANQDNFQGFVFRQINGTFGYQVTETKRFLGLFSRTKKRNVSAPWSSVSDVQADTAIPEIGGIVQAEGVPVMHADIGANIKVLNAYADGPIDGFFNIQYRDKQYLPLPATGTRQTALGTYGSQTQPSSAQFSGAGKFSGTAWIESQAVGSDPADANDSAPTETAVIRGRANFDLPTPAGDFILQGWTDCGPYMVRWYLLNFARVLESQIDNAACVNAAFKTFEPVLDDTGFEQAVLPSSVTGGVDFRAFASASGFGAATIDKILLLLAQGKPVTGGYGQLVEAYYRYINQLSPPSFVSPIRKVRRRYTSNYRIAEQMPLRDFLWDILLPSFNGRLTYSAAGKVQIAVDSPVSSAHLITSASAGASFVSVDNVRDWAFDLSGLVVVGAHTEAAEIGKVIGIEYGNPINAIAVAVSATGSLTLATSSATITGATATEPAHATLTIGGTVTDGALIHAEIDGWIIEHTALATDDRDAIAGLMAAQINGHPKLSAYVRAAWDGVSSVIKLEAKHGKLLLAEPLTMAHRTNDECVRVQAAFGGTSKHDRKIGADSFKWPLGNRQSSINQIKGEFRSMVNDWAKVPISRDYTEHQKLTRKVKPEEINLSAVDSLHQAARLMKIKGGKRRLCDWFCSFTAFGAALTLDVGDVIAVSHYSGGKWLKNIPVTVEDVSVDSEQRSKLTCRIYRSEVYDDAINEFGPISLIPVQGGSASNIDPPPPPPPDNGGTGDNGDPRDGYNVL